MRHDCRRIFPMDSPQWRASLRVIKPSSKLNRQPQPKIKSGKIAKAEKNNYSNFAATAVLAVAGILLALSLSHLAAGIAFVARFLHLKERIDLTWISRYSYRMVRNVMAVEHNVPIDP